MCFLLQYMDELRASVGDSALDVWDHYEILNKSHVDISNFGEYFITAIETLLISQRKLRVKVCSSGKEEIFHNTLLATFG